jgi:ubiquitin-conjugating enzyme E2 J2
MNSEEMTAGSIGGNPTERKWYAARSKWWNSTGGGSASNPVPGVHATTKGVGNIKAGDGGVKFRAEWPDVDQENWKWIKDNHIDPRTGKILPDPDGEPVDCSPEATALRRTLGASTTGVGAVVQGGQAARQAGQGWLSRNKAWVAVGVIFAYVILARFFGDGDEGI